MTSDSANRINRCIFFAVVLYALMVCVAVGLGDRGFMQAAAQALVVIPFAIIAAVLGVAVLAYMLSVAFGVVTFVGVLGCVLIGKRDLAGKVSERMELAEKRFADRILPPKDDHV